MKGNIIMKKMLALGLTATMVMGVLSGCSGKQDTNSSKDTDISTSTADTKETASSDENVTIRFYVCYGQAEPGYAPTVEFIKKFEADNPNIKVELENQSSTQYHEKLVSEIAADTLANVFMNWGGAEMYEAVKSQKLVDVTEMLNAEPDFKTQFSEVTLAGTNIHYEDIEGTWGVPFANVSGGFYYNEELFEKAGIMPPTTWTELLNCVEKLKAIDVIPWAIGGKDGWRVEHLYSALYYRMNGVEARKKLADRSMKYSDAEAIAPWAEMVKLVDMGAFGPEPASVDFGTECSLFQTGKAAMMFSISPFTEMFNGGESQVTGKVGFFDFPTIEGKEQFAKDNFGGGDIALGIASNATQAQIDASWKLVKALAGKDGQELFTNTNAILPTNTTITPDVTKMNSLLPAFAHVINDANAVATDLCDLDKVSTLLTKIRDVAVAVTNKQLTPEQAGAEIDAEIESYSE